ncbi:MAG TPA: PAS domain-containing protein [Gaiellaceae bacterium]|nr:PAS domain-containing protein [Gaiellaceae bacterium]
MAEAARLAALRSYEILDTPPEQQFDDLVELAAAVCDVPVATIVLVDETRAWFKAFRGIDFAEIPRDISLAAETILHDDVFVVPDASLRPDYVRSSLADRGFRFFAGAPLMTAEGHRLGAVSVLDVRARELTPVQVDALRAIARQVMTQLELRRVSSAESLARQRFRMLVEQLPGATYTEDLGASSASYMSPQIEALTGYTGEEWASEDDFFAQVLHPDDRERVLADFAAANDARCLIQIEYRVIAKDGRIVWIQDDAAVARDDDGRPLYLQGYLADVTSRKEGELKLREAQERYRTLAEQLPLVTYVVEGSTLDGPASYVSPQIEALVGYTPEEWTAGDGMFRPSVHPEDRDAVLERMRQSQTDGTELEIEYRMLRRDGRVIFVRDMAVPVRNDAGQALDRQGYLIDITERRVVERERDDLLESERAQNERLRELDGLKDEFVALISHELRTPLTSILGYLELTLDDADELSDQHRSYLEVVERNAERLLRLVGDLLFAAQIEAGKLALEWSEVEVETLVAHCVEANRPAATQAGIVLVAESDWAGAIPGDPARLAQVLDNLVSNAIKFTPAGGRVTVRVAREADLVVLEVEDSGMGIPDEEQQHLFDRFFRTRSAGEQAIPGTGLGLSIAQAIALAHGGSISVTSTEGLGTTFRIELPVTRTVRALPASA